MHPEAHARILDACDAARKANWDAPKENVTLEDYLVAVTRDAHDMYMTKDLAKAHADRLRLYDHLTGVKAVIAALRKF